MNREEFEKPKEVSRLYFNLSIKIKEIYEGNKIQIYLKLVLKIYQLFQIRWKFGLWYISRM